MEAAARHVWWRAGAVSGPWHGVSEPEAGEGGEVARLAPGLPQVEPADGQQTRAPASQPPLVQQGVVTCRILYNLELQKVREGRFHYLKIT